MSELFQRHRITALADGKQIEVPSQLRDRVRLSIEGPKQKSHVQLDTAGDLSPLLAWIDSLDLKHMRIEPLGLRAVYDRVHDGGECNEP